MQIFPKRGTRFLDFIQRPLLIAALLLIIWNVQQSKEHFYEDYIYVTSIELRDYTWKAVISKTFDRVMDVCSPHEVPHANNWVRYGKSRVDDRVHVRVVVRSARLDGEYR